MPCYYNSIDINVGTMIRIEKMEYYTKTVGYYKVNQYLQDKILNVQSIMELTIIIATATVKDTTYGKKRTRRLM